MKPKAARISEAINNILADFVTMDEPGPVILEIDSDHWRLLATELRAADLRYNRSPIGDDEFECGGVIFRSRYR